MITKNMPLVAIIIGAILIIQAVAGYAIGMLDENTKASLTAFIPAVAGLPLLICGFISRDEKKLKMGMHIAATFGLLGFIAPFGRLIPTMIKGEFQLAVSTVSMILMSLFCGIFVVLCVKSFIDVRKAREKEQAQ